MDGRWEITIDLDRCDGTGLCIGTAPDHFVAGPAGGSRPLAAVVDAADDVVLAAECCPMEAITVTEVATGRRVAPED